MVAISYLTQIEFGAGVLSELSGLLLAQCIKKPLLVTDKGLVATGIVDRVMAELTASDNVPVFDGTPSNPTETAVLKALQLYRSSECDGVLAVGGGSSIDLAKAIALLATHEAPLAQYAAIEGGVAKIGPVAPMVAVPTTSGTGSEVGRATLITLQDGRKLGLISPHLIPKVALCDPDLTMGLPSGLTAATGLDAISHCIETYLSPRVNPVAEAIALDGLERAVGAIEIAVLNGADKSARWELMMASLQGGLTFQKGLGAIHSLSHPLGALKYVNLHHGTINAILLPPVLDFNEPVCVEKYARIKKRLGLSPDQSLSRFFADLNARLGLPATLKEVGLREGDLLTIAEAAVLDHSTPTNPRPCTADDFLALLKSVY
ncbi:iron-containing alcohol dehydrogenase [Roseibium sp. CAU 1637]|uniref:Iron-containing alcohol dehydrogenase n=1 Tax=Roseibium limicola TaxID=2816037 RepID=A0A939ER55_9HYPH|nr:iron-containing alcohol dehydrogenase [Roseibium limicola]MBO0347052.1 iron-containing alcohol dehydrogenase [Roseibium limicola]